MRLDGEPQATVDAYGARHEVFEHREWGVQGCTEGIGARRRAVVGRRCNLARKEMAPERAFASLLERAVVLGEQPSRSARRKAKALA